MKSQTLFPIPTNSKGRTFSPPWLKLEKGNSFAPFQRQVTCVVNPLTHCQTGKCHVDVKNAHGLSLLEAANRRGFAAIARDLWELGNVDRSRTTNRFKVFCPLHINPPGHIAYPSICSYVSKSAIHSHKAWEPR